jgi:tetratricopeptide (TPR) repeat protein
MSGIEGLLLGRLLGDRYRIEEVIGRGGMGAVYRAVDERLGRQVAVKVITVSGGSEADSRERLRARFQREARAAAGLPHHPNVVPVYDYGSDPTLGLDYLVMELLRGNDLASSLARSGPPALSTGLRILYEASRGLAVGHRAGLIHRDVKPGNIFLAEVGQSEIQVRMVDFGIAKLVDDEDTASQLTQDGRVPHSPAFASPEQLRGLSNLTPASDVFSMGAVGFQLLTGERPFSETDRNRMSLGMPVEVPTLRNLNPAIPEQAEAIVRKALAFEPGERFADAVEMSNALEAALRSLGDVPIAPYQGGAAAAAFIPPRPQGRTHADDDDRTRIMGDEDDGDRTLLAPPEQRPPARQESVIPPRRRPPPPPERGVGGIVVWTLVVLLLAGAGFWAWSEMNRPPPPLAEQLPEAPEPFPDIATDDPTVQVELGTQPALDALVHNQEGLRLFQAGEIVGALRQFQTAVQLDPENPEYRYNFGVSLRRVGAPDEAAAELERAIQLSPRRAGAHYHLGLARLELGDSSSARVSLQRAYELSTDATERAAALRALSSLDAAQRAAPPPAIVDTLGPVRPPRGQLDTIPGPPRDTIRPEDR